ncbi:MAG: bifunctional 4-hydroxy-2-oxoglutarate aldolase/2-dehydro-3-deoxy-phosphogluconate aldolase [Candidatus Omnitrophota bacterium]|jgi:2-dehydro-3-deoxyphosphogluconate aldolase/(4S)-4-hydroxy-2-oxoglutarate aldolase
MDVARFRKVPIMGIMRGVRLDEISPLVETVIDSGLETIEITMNTKDAVAVIKQAVEAAGKRLMIGAGTVLSMESLKSALDAGATFIVMPSLVADVTAYCKQHKIPVFPGALTPQEIFNAWQAGATMVKVFPAKFFGPDYFKEIKGPFNEIELLACSGINPDNMKEYFSSGASAVSFGASVFKREWLDKKDFASIGKSIKQYLSELTSWSHNSPYKTSG